MARMHVQKEGRFHNIDWNIVVADLVVGEVVSSWRNQRIWLLSLNSKRREDPGHRGCDTSDDETM
jgi:hypothetical protein